jgi:hypothetical protein
MNMQRKVQHSETFSGERVNLADPRPDTINLTDIVTSLSRVPRFNGHTSVPFSVAQHCVLTAEIVHRLHPSADGLLERQALLRDAYVAYLGEPTRPLLAIPAYASAWEWLAPQMSRVIHDALGVPRPDAAAAELLRHCNDIGRAIEARTLMISRGDGWDLPPIPAAVATINLEPLDHQEAARQWLHAWNMTAYVQPRPVARAAGA